MQFGFINVKYALLDNLDGLYALAFLKYDEKLQNIGSTFEKDEYKSTMFDLYFKEGLVRR